MLSKYSLQTQALPVGRHDDALPNPGASIRLLEIVPGAPSAPLHCKMSAMHLDSAHQYGAISYQWGPKPTQHRPDRTIWINYRPVSVRANCYQALHQARLHLEDLSVLGVRYIWIDSICINQHDLQEKAAQVQIMASHVYPRARCVFISLPTESETIHSFVKQLAQIDSWNVTSSELRNRGLSLITAYNACLEIAHLPYWERIWVLPEMFVACDLRIFCGSHLIHWNHLRLLLDSLKTSELARNAPVTFQDFSDLPLWKVASRKKSFEQTLDLYQLQSALLSFWDWGCSDPRDRFYAFWSIVRWPAGSEKFQVDYDIPLLELARKILMAHYYGGEGVWREQISLKTFCRSALPDLLTILSIEEEDLTKYREYRESRALSMTVPGVPNQNTAISENDPRIDGGTARHTALPGLLASGMESMDLDVSELIVGFIENRTRSVPSIQAFSIGRPSEASRSLPLYNGSFIVGSVCEDACAGDLLLRLEIRGRRVYRVLRRQKSFYGVKILGHATFLPKYDMLTSTGGSHNMPKLRLRIPSSELVELVTSLYLSELHN